MAAHGGAPEGEVTKREKKRAAVTREWRRNDGNRRETSRISGALRRIGMDWLRTGMCLEEKRESNGDDKPGTGKAWNRDEKQ
jgi:hypothetical protein